MIGGQGLPNSPRWRVFALHVFALGGLVLAQPVYFWISRQPEFLVAHGLDTGLTVLLVVFLSILPPLLVVLFVLPFRIFGRAAFWCVQLTMVALLIGLFGLHAWPWQSGLLAVFAGFAIAGGVLYWRLAFFHRILSLLAVLAVLFPLVFVLTDPVRSMLDPQQQRAWIDEQIDVLPAVSAQPDINTVILMLDELPVSLLLDQNGEIDARRFPGFARLAGSATWYPYGSAIHPRTLPSTIALLTGDVPDMEAARTASWDEHPENLMVWAPALYGENVHAREILTQLCPDVVCPRAHLGRVPLLIMDLMVLGGYVVLPESVARYRLPPVDQNWAGFVELGMIGSFLQAWPRQFYAAVANRLGLMEFESLDRAAHWPEFIETVAEPQGQFYFKHLLLPHAPLAYLPDGTGYTDPIAPAVGATHGSQRGFHHYLDVQRYRSQLQYVDRLLLSLIEQLEARQQWDNTLLVLVADHGVSFRRGHDWRLVDEHNIGDVLNVAFFLKLPGQQQGRIDPYPASLIDIAPTLAEVHGHELGWETSGQSLVAAERPPRAHIPVFCGGRGGCVEELLEQADANDVIHYDVTAFKRASRDARAWVQDHSVYSEHFDLFAPRVPELGLLPRSLADFDVFAPGAGRVTLFDAGQLRKVDPAADVLPALVGGYVEDVQLREDESLLVALNGELAAVGVAGERGGRQVLGALLPAHAFVEGENELRVFRVQWQDGEAVGLKELAVTAVR